MSASTQRAGVIRTWPRWTSSTGRPRRLTATRATAATSSCRCPKDSSPRTRTSVPDGASTRRSPARIVPAPSVPVTTVPLPRTVNARSTNNRTRPSVTGAGSPPTSRASAARTSSSPAPVTALTATASTAPSEVRASRSRANASAGAGSARSARVTTSRPCRTPSESRTSTCSLVCARQPSSAATTTTTPGTGPTPASIVPTNRSWPGTSTNATVSPPGSVVQANPRSSVMPRRRSSASRSGSIPVSARTSVDLP